MINKNSKPSQRKELIRQYGIIIFTKGSIIEQIDFLDQLQQNRYKHWNFIQINTIVKKYYKTIYNDPLNIIDQSIENIKQLNKQIF